MLSGQKKEKKIKKKIEEKGVMVRSVLHDDTDWKYSPDKDAKIIQSQRYISIRDGWNDKGDTYYYEWISTQALHEIVVQCRRIEKMFKAGIITRIDLADMFHELLPLGCSGRIEFLQGYYGNYDAECIGYLVMQVVVSCYKYKNHRAVRYFMEYYIQHKNIHHLFVKSRRVRKVRDLYAVYQFNKIVEKYR